MIFELWDDEPPQSAAIPGATVATSRCFARRHKDEVRPMFYDMRIGEQRKLLPNKNIHIVRTA